MCPDLNLQRKVRICGQAKSLEDEDGPLTGHLIERPNQGQMALSSDSLVWTVLAQFLTFVFRHLAYSFSTTNC